MGQTISFILGVPLRDGSLLDGLLEWGDITRNGLKLSGEGGDESCIYTSRTEIAPP